MLGARSQRASIVAIVSIASASIACQESLRRPIDLAGEDAILVVAWLGDDGEALEAAAIASPSHHAYTALRSVRSVAWQIRASDLIRPDGTPLTFDQLSKVRARLARAPDDPMSTSCGRCLSPDLGLAPQVVHPGDSCAPPRFSKLVPLDDSSLSPGPEDAALIEIARRSVRLEWPDACACPAPAATRAMQPLTMCGVSPPELPIELPRFALAPDGTLAAFGHDAASFVSPDGRTSAQRGPEELKGRLFAADSGPGFERDAFWVEAEPYALATARGLRILFERRADGSFDAEPLSILDPAFRARRFRQLRPPGDPACPRCVHAIGELGSSEGPALYEIRLFADRRIEAVQEDVDEGPCSRGSSVAGDMLDAAVITSTGIAIGTQGRLYWRPPGARSWTCDPRTATDLVGERGNRVTSFETLVALPGGRVFLCAQNGQLHDATTAIVLTASVGSAPGPVPFEIKGELPGLFCGSRIQTSSVAIQLLVPPAKASETLALELRGDGSLGPMRTLGQIGLPADRPIRELVASPGGVEPAGAWRAARSYGGTILRSRGGGPFVPVIGPRDEAVGSITASMPIPGGFLAFASGGGPLFVDTAEALSRCVPTATSGSPRAVTALETTRAWGGGVTIDSVFAGCAGGGPIVAVGHRTDARGASWQTFARVLELEGRRLSFEELPIGPVIEPTPPDEGARIVRGAPLGGCRSVIADGLGNLSVLDVSPGRRSVQPIPLVWADPTTLAPDDAPGVRRWTALAGGEGVAWALGRSALARVTITATAARAIAFNASRLGGAFGARLELSGRSEQLIGDPRAIRALCPDFARFALYDERSPNGALLLGFAITSKPACKPEDATAIGDLSICEAPFPHLPSPILASPIAFVGPADRLTLVVRTGALERGGVISPGVGPWLVSASQDAEGRALLGCDARRILLAIEP